MLALVTHREPDTFTGATTSLADMGVESVGCFEWVTEAGDPSSGSAHNALGWVAGERSTLGGLPQFREKT